MELASNELLMLEQGLEALKDFHEKQIVEIKSLPSSSYEFRVKFNKYLYKPLTAEDYRNKDIEKEIEKIQEIEKLKKKMFLSNNYLLLVSNRIRLCISDR